MNISYNRDRVGPDHQIRRRFRDFLLVRWAFEPDGSVLQRLQEEKDVPAAMVKAELDRLIAANWKYDDVWSITTDDLRDFAAYTETQVAIEKAMVQLRKAVRMTREAGIGYSEVQGITVDLYSALDKEEADRIDADDRASGQLVKDPDSAVSPDF